MNYYHCSPTPELTLLEPRTPEFNNKPQAVYLAELFPMALLYGIHNFEYAYGFTKEKALYYSEYFPDALKTLYAGKSASVYLCAPGETQGTRIPFEALSFTPVKVLEEIQVPDLYEALLEQERLGTIAIHRYADHSQGHLNWIRQAELNVRPPGQRRPPCRLHPRPLSRHLGRSRRPGRGVNRLLDTAPSPYSTAKPAAPITPIRRPFPASPKPPNPGSGAIQARPQTGTCFRPPCKTIHTAGTDAAAPSRKEPDCFYPARCKVHQVSTCSRG